MFLNRHRLEQDEVLIINNIVASIIVLLSILADILVNMWGITGEVIGIVGGGILILFYFTSLSKIVTRTIKNADSQSSQATDSGKLSDRWLSLITFIGVCAFAISKLGYTCFATETQKWITTIVLIVFEIAVFLSLVVVFMGEKKYGIVEVAIIIVCMLALIFVTANWAADIVGIEFMNRLKLVFYSFNY